MLAAADLSFNADLAGSGGHRFIGHSRCFSVHRVFGSGGDWPGDRCFQLISLHPSYDLATIPFRQKTFIKTYKDAPNRQQSPQNRA